jgi:hypothetical protein
MPRTAEAQALVDASGSAIDTTRTSRAIATAASDPEDSWRRSAGERSTITRCHLTNATISTSAPPDARLLSARFHDFAVQLDGDDTGIDLELLGSACGERRVEARVAVQQNAHGQCPRARVG